MAIVDGKANYLPCFQFSPLDCFKEGDLSVPGLTNNTRYTDSYGFTRISYHDPDFDFATNFTDKYLQAGPSSSFCTVPPCYRSNRSNVSDGNSWKRVSAIYQTAT